MTRDAVLHHTADLRQLHDGVWVTGDAPITRLQHWWAATLSAPGRVLAFASAGAAYEFRPWESAFEVVVQEGNGGPRRFGPLLVCRAKHIDATTLHGLPITTPERTIADLWPKLNDRERRKMLREALRLMRTTVPRARSSLERAAPRNRPSSLTQLLKRYTHLQLRRCKSDAEAYAVELIAAAKLPHPEINVRRAGVEADLSWPDHRLIIEIDGDQFDQDKAEDARKTRIWQQARWRVRRAESDLVSTRPAASQRASNTTSRAEPRLVLRAHRVPQPRHPLRPERVGVDAEARAQRRREVVAVVEHAALVAVGPTDAERPRAQRDDVIVVGLLDHQRLHERGVR
jgi:very-short-patch-repair endonuclease